MSIGDDDELPFEISFHELQKYPATVDELDSLTALLPTHKPPKPFAFILHHTFWNDVNVTATVAWIDQVTETITKYFTFLPRPAVSTYFPPTTKGFPRLFVTANSAGTYMFSAPHLIDATPIHFPEEYLDD